MLVLVVWSSWLNKWIPITGRMNLKLKKSAPTPLLTYKYEKLRIGAALAETMFNNLAWSRTCSTRSWLFAVIQRVFSTSLCNVLYALLRNRGIIQMICYRGLTVSTIFSGFKALHHMRYTGNSCIHFSPNFRANIRHGSITREKPLLPPSCTLW